MKKTVHSFLLILVLLLLPTAFASAVETPPINEISDDVSFVEWFNFLRSDDYSFSYVSAGIKGGDGCVYVTGETETNKKVACVGGFAAIQRWENNQWKTYKKFGFDRYDASSSSFDRTVTVDRGYYYRLYVYHSAEYVGGSLSKSSTTKSVLVN